MILIPRYLNAIFCLFSIIIYGQVKKEYYVSAENLADDNLKFALNQIIDNHTEFNYTSSNTDVWDILKETDRDPNNSDNVILIYSGVSVNGAQEYNSANGWTREHVWAKSRGNFGTAIGTGTDVHALRPLDNTTNSKRNNRSFNNCITCEDVTDKWGNITGSKKDMNDWSFEPRDAVKGDVARMLFYMTVRYEGLDGYPDLELTELTPAKTDKEPIHGVLSTLLTWHRNDPVDTWEENRNNIIYNSYQNNRNPFIDYPKLAEHIWGTEMGVNWNSEVLSNTKVRETSFYIYPNPIKNIIHIKGISKSTQVYIYDTLGRKVLETTINTKDNDIDVSGLSGVYLINIIYEGKKVTKLAAIE